MSPWRIAWRLRRVALTASVLLLVLSLLLFWATQALVAGLGFDAASMTLLSAIYLLPDALFVGMLLEAMLAAGGLPSWRRVLLPSGRALGFMAAMAPFALLAAILHAGARWPLERLLLADGVDGFGTPERLAFIVLYQPAWDWLLLGLVAAPLAVRTLALPRLPRRPSTLPDARLFGILVGAVALSIAAAVLLGLPAQLGAALFYPLQWLAGYVAGLLLLTPIAAAVGGLLMRRAGHPALA